MLVKPIIIAFCACIFLLGGCVNNSGNIKQISAVQIAQAVQRGEELRQGNLYRITGKVHQLRDKIIILEAGEVSWINLMGTEKDVQALRVRQQITVLGRYLRYERLETCGGLGNDLYFEVVKEK